MADREEQSPLLPPSHNHANQPQSRSQLYHFTTSTLNTGRRKTKRFLTSRTGHYSILLLVSLDVSCIFADLIITSLSCHGPLSPSSAAKASKILGLISLVFSCLFMVELLASIWAFGVHFFSSMFHCFDAIVILTGFVIDVLLRGTIEEEIGSIVVVLRLWRVLKIIDELLAGAAEQMEPLTERIRDLEKQNGELKREVKELRKR